MVTLKEEAQAALVDIGTATGMTVAVVIAGKSGTGLCVNESHATQFTEQGETGQMTGTVRVSCADFPTSPKQGETFLIGGAAAVVQQRDSSGALWVIQYSKVRPVTGV